MIDFDRRSVLTGLAATGAVSLTGFASPRNNAAFVACCRKPSGAFAAAVLDQDANVLFMETLDARGHDAAISPDGKTAIIFARRPGRFAMVLDLANQCRVTTFTPPPDRHFFGHGFFSPDGRVLFATENDYEAERGILGIYDATDKFHRIGAFETGGIGPHEALLLSDQRTIAVANGGIATHPDYPRQKLNLSDMAPSITLLDIRTGDIVETTMLPKAYHQLSIRHIAEAGDGSLWFGGQYEGAEMDLVPLVGRYQRGTGIELIDTSNELYRAMKQYIGSIAVSRDGTQIATTSPRGGRVIIWDVSGRRPIEVRDIPDVCGAARNSTRFALSDGSGNIHLEHLPEESMRSSDRTMRQKKELGRFSFSGETENAQTTSRSHNLSWDNHLMAIV